MLFLGLGYSIRETGFALDRKAPLVVLVTITFVATGGIAVDVSQPEPTYTATFAEELQVDLEGPWMERPVGAVVIENTSVLARTVQAPTYVACAYTADGVQCGWEEELWIAPGEEKAGYMTGSTLLRAGDTARISSSLLPIRHRE